MKNFITQSAVVRGLEGCRGLDWFDCIAAHPISDLGLPFMSRDQVVSISSSELILKAFKRMKDHHIGGLPVVEGPKRKIVVSAVQLSQSYPGAPTAPWMNPQPGAGYPSNGYGAGATMPPQTHAAPVPSWDLLCSREGKHSFLCLELFLCLEKNCCFDDCKRGKEKLVCDAAQVLLYFGVEQIIYVSEMTHC
ncbi:hypothetical protein SOVF_202660 [Spinacia oleracea]|nr:hypothetical protein SOVF_202660 [Spinacia oleracea]